MYARKPPQRAPGRATDKRAVKQKPLHTLYYGDNLDNMRKMDKESVDLCYMDPPFNSKRNYNQIYLNIGEDRAQAQAFIDTWKWDDHARSAHKQILGNDEGRFPPPLIELVRGLHRVLGEGSLFAYLVGMSVRISEIRRVLKVSGSFYLHCDPTSSHYLKLICDAIFCSQGGNFQNEIIWRRTTAHNDPKRFGRIHDVLLFYVKSFDAYFRPQFVPLARAHISERFAKDDVRGRYKLENPTGAGIRGGDSGEPWQGFDPTTRNRHWAPPRKICAKLGIDNDLSTREKLDALLSAGYVQLSKTHGNIPMIKTYLEGPETGTAYQDIWAYQPYTQGYYDGDDTSCIDQDVMWLGPTAPERLGYPTQKPVGLLERIIESSCPTDGIVFDPCCGCGTTIAAAQKRGRRWIGIDITFQSISLVLQRLEDQVGPAAWPEFDILIEQTGVPRDMASAVALAHKRDDRVRKEFEKWAVLTYTNNRAKINEKKGADGGIDGRVYFLTSATTNASMVIQVKSGIVNRSDIAQLRGDMHRDGAEMATLITLAKPTSPMIAEAKTAGSYHHDLMDRGYDRIQIVTVQEIIEDRRRLDIPLVKEAAKPRDKRRPGESLSLPGMDGSLDEQPPEVADMVDYLKRGSADVARAAPGKAPVGKPLRKKSRED
jgi:DNA modification methylase